MFCLQKLLIHEYIFFMSLIMDMRPNEMKESAVIQIPNAGQFKMPVVPEV